MPEVILFHVAVSQLWLMVSVFAPGRQKSFSLICSGIWILTGLIGLLFTLLR